MCDDDTGDECTNRIGEPRNEDPPECCELIAKFSSVSLSVPSSSVSPIIRSTMPDLEKIQKS